MPEAPRPVMTVAQQLAEWQPIEDAPKDGRHIIVPGGLAYWRDVKNGDHEARPGWFCITGEAWPGRRITWDLTHWQPFPIFRPEEN